ncbi:PaaX family transcriptional regulator C-terminal domain-containing protein [Sulfitobacter donghicola]|uniref:PaaX family transcriptional regulator n=1 Tax=Sulfitobacter donghicola DSW-25 = KCTC 12864 = JCM 14565 TaxID=1300350 RepID=A0A073IM97_9RHOB|nr:PaaX family transcriptional regulator C-terminal domain-containing protein [Sulfitobacter donghicola]KEJ90715.1 PaaX family transcriptional regulator [Sulfitobacter donghicola DSW-25 = KCTC 12864 = JCM 14565]KIN67969.1 PaaX domain protein [Sulfitobacter donghicola DSW-25 = KCTC 12864 = JCM 14565]
MTPEKYSQTKASLLELGGQRVWSLMVTIFGDLAQAQDNLIDGPTLSAIMNEMDVRPEAVRVALHRLRNDGWIMSQKQGRTRLHALTPKSRAESLTASARIYANPALPKNANWQLVILETSASHSREKMAKRGFVALLPRVYFGEADANPPLNALTIQGGQAPEWLARQLLSQSLEDDYNALLPVLETVAQNLREGTLDSLQVAALRCLIVHNWRRIVLRQPHLPASLLPENWVGYRCHVLVDQLLAQLPRPAIADILPN